MNHSSDILSSIIGKRLNIPEKQVRNTVSLFIDGATIPFISRYRKEMTGSLDEVAIGEIKLQLDKLNELLKRKEYVLKKIQEQQKLTPALKEKISSCWDETKLEDIYLPFKKKTKTKATVAREKGLEPLAKTIMRQYDQNIDQEAKKFINSQVTSIDQALEGARHIISEWINENEKSREIIRRLFKKEALICSKLIKKKEKEATNYKDYFSFSQPLSKIPSHRLLAIFRAEKESFLKVNLEIDDDNAIYHLNNYFIKNNHSTATHIRLSVEDAYKRMLFPSIENEFRKSAKESADDEAISVFAENLKQLLLASPLGSKNILALDPGFRTGCKVVVLDANGDLVLNTTIYPHPPQMKVEESLRKIKELVKDYKIEAIAIGNGTAGKESMQLLKSVSFDSKVNLFLVNESGASIYSASKIAREEFPDHDVTVRGAVSIGRRLMDPLAELVKIDAKSIGVGQYQHDVNQTKLKEKLDLVVISCVNSIGVNLNTASKHLLNYVSGLGSTMAQNIIDHRAEIGSFKSRKELLNVPRLGKKAFEQAAGFLRIRDGVNPLDNTAVHPESYKITQRIIRDHDLDLENIRNEKEKIKTIALDQYVTDKIGIPTLKDILTELEKPGLDPRGEAHVFHFADGVNSIDDLRTGMILPGLVNNITKFGAFIDIGIKESGMVHISQIVNRFIKDPAEVLKLNQEVKVKILDIDKDRKRISLSMKEVS